MIIASALLTAIAVAYAGYLLSRLAPIGTAYAAKILCSGVFVSARSPESVIADEIRADNHPLLNLIRPFLDPVRKRASATFLGMARREAQYRDGLGCTLALGIPADSLLSAATAGAIAPSAPALHREARPLEVASPPAGIDATRLSAALDAAFAEPQATQLLRTRAVVVLHRGCLIAERYAPGFTGTTPLLGWSMTKSVSAVLMGVLVKEGRLSLQSSALLPEWRAPGDARAGITLDQLLRMNSGLGFNENVDDPLSDVVMMLFARADGVAFATSKPLVAAPGSHWQYSSGTSALLARIMRIAIGGSDADYLAFPRRALFDRIGMQSAVIETDTSGAFQTSSFMYASAHDWARLGQLLLQDGVWNGERILPDGWVRYLTTLTAQSRRQDFGAHVWVRVPEPFNRGSGSPATIPADAFHMAGHEGQLVSVIPSRELVVVRLGLSRGHPNWDHETFLAGVLAAFR